MKRIHRLWCVLLVLVMMASSLSASADYGWLPTQEQVDMVADVIDDMGYDTATEVGTLVEGTRVNASDADRKAFSFTPVDYVIVIDRSYSMEISDSESGKNKLQYVKQAVQIMIDLAFSMSPESRIAVVSYCGTASIQIQLTGKDGIDQLRQATERISLGSYTSIEAGYRLATELLDRANTGNPRTILMLTDGQPNVGGDPEGEARAMGEAAAQKSLVFTFGLIGGLQTNEREAVKGVLDSGYARKYYPIDFASVSELEQIFTDSLTEALVQSSVSTSEDKVSGAYFLHVSQGMDVQVRNTDTGVLSTAPDAACGVSTFGVATTSTNGADVVLDGVGKYTIMLHGTVTDDTQCRLTLFNQHTNGGLELLNQYFYCYPGKCVLIEVEGYNVTVTELPYDILDDDARDPFTGELTNGSDRGAYAKVSDQVIVFSKPSRKGENLGKLKRHQAVYILAQDPVSKDRMIAFFTGGKLVRGWVPQSSCYPGIFIPDFVWKYQDTMTVSQDTKAYRTPDSTNGLEATTLKRGTKVTVRFVEDDRQGNEWAYVETAVKGKPSLVYIPGSALSGWNDKNPQSFRIARNENYMMMYLGEIVTFGRYQQEPVTWYVVEVNEQSGVVTLVSEKAVDVVRYHTNKSYTAWRDSYLRKWLNNTFVSKAFNGTERNAIVDTVVEGSVDKAYILSESELIQYAKQLGYTGTSYPLKWTAFCQTTRTDSGNDIFINTKAKIPSASWWLRIPYTDTKAKVVAGSGKINGANNDPTCDDNGVRPVIRVYFSAVDPLK